MSHNRLADATSPYLLQHKDNPVHWWPWCAEAIEEAKRSNRPILLSVGYAACHWCHVMAHESFEDEATAEVMNRLFVNIKVDREERPDIDAIYMSALHLLGQQGGWPLTMFLDSDAKPFFGGTYFPKDSLYGRPAFTDVLEKISHIYRNEYDKVAHNTAAILNELEKNTRARASASGHLLISDELLEDLTGRMVKAVDPDHGGLTGAPKFPQWSFFWLLWRGAIRYGNEDAKRAVINTLTHICQGGIYDHIGGGFARYSVDELWLVPHFEKMLYDNALLLDLLTEVHRETQDPLFAARIRETVDWLEREMIAEGGAFAASLDADSEGEEGKFYVWSYDEIVAVLGDDDARIFCEAYDISPGGNWEGTNIPNRLHDLAFDTNTDHEQLAPLRKKLFDVREKRIRPGWDDKVLADWNGLMIASLVHAGQALGEPAWIDRARAAFDFVLEQMSENGRLKHAHRAGKSAITATASDYANMIWAALRLYQATGELTFLTEAARLTATLNAHHWVDSEKRFATTANDADDVIVRLATGTDDAVPGPNGIMVTNLAHLALATGNNEYVRQAAEMIDGFSAEMGANPVAHATLLAGAMDILRPQQVAIFIPGEDTAMDGQPPLRKTLFSLSLPGALEFIVHGEATGLSPALEGKSSHQGKPTAYVCLGPQCSLPITTADELMNTLQTQRRRPPKQEPPPKQSS